MKRCIKEPIPAVHAAIEVLISAVDAHIAGERAVAAKLFAEANNAEAWHWLDRPWIDCQLNVVDWKPEGDTRAVPVADRDPLRDSVKLQRQLLERDGFHCRFCGLRVIPADVRKLAHHLYPEEVPWNSRDPKQQHAGFQVSWLQFDHVVPHSHGGRTSLENMVVCCALCNFGKFNYTLKQLDVEDPRLRPPAPSDFDGLMRLCHHEPPVPRKTASVAPKKPSASEVAEVERYFFPGGTINKGFALVPPLAGKSRWFEIGGQVAAEAAVVGGVDGVIVTCPRKMITRRGLDPESLRLQ